MIVILFERIPYSLQSVTNFLVLVWLKPDDFTREGEKSDTGKG